MSYSGLVMSKKSECGSLVNGIPAKGCVHCMNGSKMVLFISGICGKGCFYCPVSNDKKEKDVVYANERPICDDDEIIAEAESMDATGTGITGGDPLMEMDRTLSIIRLLKDKIGSGHHIHLYTSTIDAEKTMALEEAGLDEIRFHPHADVWEAVGTTDLNKILSTTNMFVGIEVPAIPDMSSQLETLVSDAIRLGVDFININELEFSESNWDMMGSRRYGLKDELSSAVSGSENTAENILERFPDANIRYCSSLFKDSVQLRKRLIRTAKRIAKEYEAITEDGTIMRGLIYSDDTDGVFELLRNEYYVPDELMSADLANDRIEIAPWIVEEIAAELPYKCYIVEEYPTANRLEVERTPL